MSSSASSRLLDLDRGLPTTPADVEALRRLAPRRIGTAEYLEFLRLFEPKEPAALRERPGPSGPEPFRL